MALQRDYLLLLGSWDKPVSVGITVMAYGAGGGVVTLSGENVFAFSFMSQATAEIFLQTDGTVDRRVNFGIFTQIDVATDWVIPNGDSPGSFRARFRNLSGDALAFASAAVNVYRAFTVGSYVIRQIDNSPFAGGQDTTVTLEIDDGAVAQDNGSYRLQADREDF